MDIDVDRSADQAASRAAQVPDKEGVCSRPVDLVHLARYTMGNRALEKEILELFVAQAEGALERLAIAADERAWREAAHTIKGSARAVGAWRLGNRAEAAERLRGQALGEQREAAQRAVAEAMAATVAYIQALFPEEGAAAAE